MAKRQRPIVEMLRASLKNAPFVGLVVHTSDGDAFRISHPDYVMIGPKADLVICYDDDQHPHILNPAQIVSIEPAKPKSEPPPGRPSRGRG